MRIGPIKLSAPFCQAGLAGYSDRAMRLVARRRGCGYAVTEALLDTILLSGGLGLKKSIDINDEDHPIAGQIIGSEPETMAAAAKIIAGSGYDVVDLNFACPVKKIKNKARGGHMLRDTQRGISILRAVRAAVASDIPTTVSLRRGFDDSPESVERFEELIEAAWALGYAAVRVHARTVEQKYLGRSAWDFLRDLKSRYPHKTILGSGDVFTAEDALRMWRETGVDIVWIARGAIGNPWIFRDAEKLRCSITRNDRISSSEHRGSAAETMNSTEKEMFSEQIRGALTTKMEGITAPTLHEQRSALLEHFELAMQLHGEQLAGRRMRKMGIKYARFHPRGLEVKSDFIAVRSLRDWNDVLTRWYETDGPGIFPEPSAADEVNDALETASA